MGNYKAGPFKKHIWKGDPTLWAREVRTHVPDIANLTTSFRVVQPPSGEHRLVLQAHSKAVRAQLIGAVRKAQGHIKAFPALTPWERSNKRLLITYAQRRNLVIMDNGDRCYLRSKGIPTPPNLSPVLLDASPEDVLQQLENAFAALSRPTGPPPPRSSAPPRRPGNTQPYRSWVEAAAPRNPALPRPVQQNVRAQGPHTGLPT